MALTAAQVDTLQTPGWYPDGLNRLYLRIGPTGAKSWVVRYRQDGKRVDKGIGGVQGVTLDRARELAQLTLAQKVLRPAPTTSTTAAKRAPRPRPARPTAHQGGIPTLGEAARLVLDKKMRAGNITNPQHAKNWIQVLERHVLKELGDLPLDQVGKHDVLGVLGPIWHTLPETAKRIQGRLLEIFAWGIALDHVTASPVDPRVVRAALDKQKHEVVHFRALPYAEVPAAYAAIDGARQAIREVKLALCFTMLTACRSGEVRGMRWSELSDDWKVWTIPASRTKTSKEHRVPLCEQARFILMDAQDAVAKRRKRRADYDPAGLVFPHPEGRPLSDAALTQRLRRDCVDCTVHGFRTSFRTWVAEQTDLSWEAAELCLAHNVGTAVARAYMRSDLLEDRAPVMQQWGDYVDPLPF